MLETVDVVEKEDAPITGRQIQRGAINSQTINDPALRQIMHTETAPEVFPRNILH